MFRHDALAKGRYRRVPSRWDTEFGRWVADFGVPRIDPITRDVGRYLDLERTRPNRST